MVRIHPAPHFKMNKTSEITAFIQKLLENEKEPRPMKWIVEEACKHFIGYYNRYENQAFHRKIWNATYNACAAPMKRPKLIKSLSYEGAALFEFNRN